MLVISAVLLSVSISVASRALSGSEAEIALSARDQARFYAEGCVDYALMQLRTDLSYAGNESILIGDGDCEVFSIEDDGAGTLVLRVESIVRDHAYRIMATVDTADANIVVSSYSYVAHF